MRHGTLWNLREPMLQKTHLSTLVYGAFGIMAVMLFLEGAQVTTGLFKPCGTVVTGLALAMLIFDKWAWSFRIFHPWFVDKPYLKGTWKGVLESSYIRPETGEKVQPIEVYLVIRQTYSAIHFRLITRESESESVANNIYKGQDGVYTVASVYRNTPRLTLRDKSPIHHGAMLIRVDGDPASQLNGEYWTDRVTRGEIRFHERSKKLHFNFQSAEAERYY